MVLNLESYPDIQIVEVDDTSDLMKKLFFGEIDAVLSNINIGNFMIKQLQDDRFGHQIGDIVLKKLAALIKQRIRSSDIPGCWGG